MAVLLQFNEQTNLTIQQLGENTGKWAKNFFKKNVFNSHSNWFSFAGIAQENLLQVLQILLKAKLLTCSDEEINLTGSSVIELFLGYKK